MMKRDECLRILARYHTDQIVVATYQAAFEWMVIKPNPLNYLSIGAMGQASSHALGLALGRPDKRVIVLDGDGSLLMNLGSLVTIAEVAPPNLLHFVCENGTYEANGGHPIPRAGKLSFAGLALAAGYRRTYEFDDLSDFDTNAGRVLEETGPVLIDLEVEPGESYPQPYGTIHSAAVRDAFKNALRNA
jgi:phosphonopyruvate decarboxylase